MYTGLELKHVHRARVDMYTGLELKHVHRARVEACTQG